MDSFRLRQEKPGKGDVVSKDSSKGKIVESFCSAAVCTKQRRIAELAKKRPTMVLSTLAHHMDAAWLRKAYDRTRRDGAVAMLLEPVYEQDF